MQPDVKSGEISFTFGDQGSEEEVLLPEYIAVTLDFASLLVTYAHYTIFFASCAYFIKIFVSFNIFRR